MRVHADDRQYAYWNHAALITSPSGNLVEATSKGVRHGDLTEYTPNDYYLVRIRASDEDRAEVVSFGEWAANVHARYGWLTIASIAVPLLIWGFSLVRSALVSVWCRSRPPGRKGGEVIAEGQDG